MKTFKILINYTFIFLLSLSCTLQKKLDTMQSQSDADSIFSSKLQELPFGDNIKSELKNLKLDMDRDVEEITNCIRERRFRDGLLQSNIESIKTNLSEFVQLLKSNNCPDNLFVSLRDYVRINQEKKFTDSIARLSEEEFVNLLRICPEFYSNGTDQLKNSNDVIDLIVRMNNRDDLKSMIIANPLALRRLRLDQKTDELIDIAVEENGLALRHVEVDRVTKDLIFKTIRQGINVLDCFDVGTSPLLDQTLSKANNSDWLFQSNLPNLININFKLVGKYLSNKDILRLLTAAK